MFSSVVSKTEISTTHNKIVITFNWKDGAKTVTLAELKAADEAASVSANTGNVLQINDFRGSHLVDNAPP